MGSPGVAATPGRPAREWRVPAWGWVALAVVALAALLLLWFVLLRGGARATVDGVSVECAAATGQDAEACQAWGLEILAAGPEARVFELTDVDRIAFDRELFGLGDACSVTWFIGRYPDRPALTDEVACR